ncbi:Phosphoribosyl 1,2-cyclic phosphodiesterase [Rubripirellula lacrimiformis]|uniref:Phosphoribosyl 1,2-cyclic phosphodiesterase n=1 Tax=Rubripirellula lacrimiformis TaxID=1930273 RepID=A0A517NH52_9BACT|nr:MBL fold metallo-hydrolase [Rubripirellula lacrimiformis]QDT06466.1 Phosphoribosyl 1,2-cyclic phosphodiesterase [Rubripirellula lacrimiformis]
MTNNPDPTSTPPTHAKVTFLGTGTSVGVPVIGCQCEVCQSDDPRNQRTRCAITIELGWHGLAVDHDEPTRTLLVDTPPDLRFQLLREKIPLVHAVLYTHEHADHLFGLDDLRLFPFRLGGPVPLYCEPKVEQRIKHSFDYAFSTRAQTHPGSRPQLECREISPYQPIPLFGASIMPIRLKHGPHFDVLGFRIGDFAYCTDTNDIPPESMARLAGVKTFVVGALRHQPHPTHFSVDQAVEVARQVGAKQTWLTHVSHDLDYGPTTSELPDGIDLAYDGLQVDVGLDSGQA